MSQQAIIYRISLAPAEAGYLDALPDIGILVENEELETSLQRITRDAQSLE